MDLKQLEALGITADDLINRIVDKAVEEMLSSEAYDEDGEPTGSMQSQLSRRIREKMQKHIDSKIQALAEEHILPRVAAYIETLSLQATNRWGEKTGKSLTFIEYLTERAEAYMRDEVNHEGKSKDEEASSGYTWSKNTTRVAYMVNKHLQYSIETAMKQAMATANSTVAKGLEEATKISLQNVLAAMKITVKTST